MITVDDVVIKNLVIVAVNCSRNFTFTYLELILNRKAFIVFNCREER